MPDDAFEDWLLRCAEYKSGEAKALLDYLKLPEHEKDRYKEPVHVLLFSEPPKKEDMS